MLPQVFTEGKIDVDKLHAALGDAADERPERYSFTWAGKRAAIQEGQSFRVCLDDELKAATVKELNLKRSDLFICRDVAIDDKLAANLALQCRLKSI